MSWYLLKPNVPSHVYKFQPTVPILRQINPARNLIPPPEDPS